VRSTKSPSWINGIRKALGYDPVPAPPHAFSIDARRLRYGQFVRDRHGFRLRNWRQAALPPDAFHSGLLGGPLRDPAAFTALVGNLLQGLGIREASLVVPDRSGPNVRLVGLIVAAGVTVTTLDFVIALVVPEIVTALLLSAGIVVTSKG